MQQVRNEESYETKLPSSNFPTLDNIPPPKMETPKSPSENPNNRINQINPQNYREDLA